MGGGMMGGLGGLGLFGGLAGSLFFVVLLAGLIVLGIWLWRTFGGSASVGSGAWPREVRRWPALEILKARYASGEIDRDEYERIRESLS